jgi:tetratricopeptide (TPR) repeat protein
MLRKTLIVLVILSAMVLGGCQKSQKNIVKERWNQASSPMKYGLAMNQYNEGQYDVAAKTIKECIAADKNAAEPHLLYGKILFEQNQKAEAVDEINKALQMNPKLHEGWYLLGKYNTSNKKEALDCFSKALENSPTNLEYISSVTEGYIEQNQNEQAEALINEKLVQMPDNYDLIKLAGGVMFQLSRHQRAIELYESYMLKESSDVQTAENLGYCYIFAGQWDKAAAIFKKLVNNQSDKQLQNSYLQLAGMCEFNSSNYSQAARSFEKMAVNERDNPQLWFKIGQAALAAGDNKTALECASKALIREQGYVGAYVLTGCVKYKNKQYKESLENFEKAVGDKEFSAFAWLMKSRCFEKMGLNDDAKMAFNKSLEINPESKFAVFLAKEREQK